jgi:hypothetical protein
VTRARKTSASVPVHSSFAASPSRHSRPADSYMSDGTENLSCRSLATRNIGVPFGQDRIVPIFLATLAVQQKSQTIRFKSAADMMDTFSMSKGGKEYRRLIAAFERVFGATIFFGTDTLTANAKVIQRSRFSFFREARIWYNRGADEQLPSERFENIIVLSDEFFQEIMAHPIPTDLEVVKLLSSAPAVLDLFRLAILSMF